MAGRNSKLGLAFAAALALALCAAPAGAQQTWYVDSTGGADGNSGLDWGNAKQTLSAVTGLGNPATGGTYSPGDTVWVKGGVYTNTDQVALIDITILGGFPDSMANPGINDRNPDENPTTVTVSIARRVYIVRNNTVIDGLVITGGDFGTGGGLYMAGANQSAVARNCRIVGNVGTAGGGVAIIGGGGAAGAILENCVIAENLEDSGSQNSTRGGGGVSIQPNAVATLIDCVIVDNSSINNGGAGLHAYNDNVDQLTSATLVNCLIERNTSGVGNAPSYGGAGVFLVGTAGDRPVDAAFTSCSISRNVATAARGGGMFTYLGVTMVMYDCILTENTGVNAGAGSYHASLIDGSVIEGTEFTSNVLTGSVGSNVGGGGVRFGNVSLLVRDCVVAYNTSSGYGGGCSIYDIRPEFNDYLTVSDCVFTGNESQYGGAVSVYRGDPLFDGCKLEGNHATTDGGGAYIVGNDGLSDLPRFEDCEITGNTADTRGGGAYALSGTGTFLDCAITSNVAVGNSGGGLQLWNGETVVQGCLIAYNSANDASNGRGGGVAVRVGAPVVRECRIVGNEATLNGGGVFSENGSATIESCVIADNYQSVFDDKNWNVGGGGVSITGSHSPTVTSCTIMGNDAENLGGGIYCGPSAEPLIAQCFITGNTQINFHAATAADGGGGAYHRLSDPVYENCVFAGNECHKRGGGVHCYEGDAVFANCTFARNRVQAYEGHAVTVYSADPVFVNTIFAHHTAATNAAATAAVVERNTAGEASLYNCLFHDNGENPAADQHFADENDLNNPLSTANEINNNADPAGSTAGNLVDDPLFPAPVLGAWTADATYDATTCRTTYTAAPGTFEPGELVGKMLNPRDVTANWRQLRIAANTDATVEVWGDMTRLGGDTGQPFGIYEYTIPDTSPAVNAGTDTLAGGSIPTVDILGHPRPAIPSYAGGDALYDIGAYEAVPDGADADPSDVRFWTRY